MRIKMELISDTIFGNGISVPGAEDISVQCDSLGFPYYKGGTFKGIFREEFENYLYISGTADNEIRDEVSALFGESGSCLDDPRKLVFSDLSLSEGVREAVLGEIGSDDPMRITEAFTHVRTFTRIDEDGMVEEGSLRSARCIDKGLCFYGEIKCADDDRETVKKAIRLVKSIGTMRNRGFGRVKIEAVTEDET